MKKLDQITLADIVGGLVRYRPFIAVAVAIVLVAAFLPGAGDRGGLPFAAGGGQVVESGDGFDNGFDGEFDDEFDGEFDDEGRPIAGTGTRAGTRTGTGTGAGTRTQVASQDQPLGTPDLPVANCDPATGRIAIPSRFAPPCVPAFSGDNGGATHSGVSANEIVLVYYQPQSNAAVDAALTAAGANNTPDDQWATTHDWTELLVFHFETYGREVRLERVRGSGASDDDAAAVADARQIATEIRPFAVWGSNNNAFIDELAARQIVCVCSVSQPQEFYEARAPYAGYTTLMSSTQGYMHRAEYIGKRLARRNAEFAGTSDGVPLSVNERSFALLYFETEDNAYRSGAQFFDRHLREVYGVQLADSIAYTGPPNLSETQNQARPFIARLKEKGVTSIVFAGDFISPAIFTQEATRQNYFPEWIITGSALTDTTIFARTYDPLQWNKAFGVSFLSARIPEEQGTAFNLHLWHFGRTPTAHNQYAVLLASPWATMLGIHMAGPNLTPHNFQQGLFNYPVSGRGMVTSPTSSWGNHGVWPFTDYTQFDDVTEIWWDPNALGEDEVGNDGRGMYRYVDGGRRFLPGEHPSSDVTAFQMEGSITMYDELPESDRRPEYPRPRR